jgi:predicted N-formylglutamate amidohydrolase
MTVTHIVWPEPVETLNEHGASDIVLLCEHASNHIPAAYGGLGVSPTDLTRHIAWDIGAAEVTRHLSQALDAPAFMGTSSRLLIDLNRPLQAPDCIPPRSDGTDIPGNAYLSDAERERRMGHVHRPYHQRVSAFLDARQRSGRPTRLVSIHSFTPVMNDIARIWHAGVLYAQAEEFAVRIAARLTAPDLTIGLNEPYKTSRETDYGIPIHGDDRNIPAIMIEIRQDLIADSTGARQWAERLAHVFAT